MKGMPWDDYIAPHMRNEKGVNEVNLIAHLKGVKGIVVHDVIDQMPTTENRERYYAEQLAYASKVRKHLYTHHADLFPEGSLPIMSYSKSHTRQLEQVSERLIAAAEHSQSRQDAPGTSASSHSR